MLYTKHENLPECVSKVVIPGYFNDRHVLSLVGSALPTDSGVEGIGVMSILFLHIQSNIDYWAIPMKKTNIIEKMIYVPVICAYPDRKYTFGEVNCEGRYLQSEWMRGSKELQKLRLVWSNPEYTSNFMDMDLKSTEYMFTGDKDFSRERRIEGERINLGYFKTTSKNLYYLYLSYPSGSTEALKASVAYLLYVCRASYSIVRDICYDAIFDLLGDKIYLSNTLFDIRGSLHIKRAEEYVENYDMFYDTLFLTNDPDDNIFLGDCVKNGFLDVLLNAIGYAK